MGRIFGTDGVRGVAGAELTAQLAMDLAVAAVPVLAPAATASNPTRRPVAVIGRDSRASGDFLEAAVVAGLASSGVDVLRLGVIPTPAVAYLTGALGADFGVVLSASHNPAADNGIKFFGRAGVKLADETEDEIEAALLSPGGATPRTPRLSRQPDLMARTATVSEPPAETSVSLDSPVRTDFSSGPPAETAVLSDPPAEAAVSSGLPAETAVSSDPPAEAAGSAGFSWVSAFGFGRVTDAYSANEAYLDHLLATLPVPASGQLPLAGLRVVVDCAHGAAYSIGPRALRRAGAEVVAIGAAPDGLNINAGVGSTHLDALAVAVLEHGADAGLAFDGDADRCLAVDGDGQPLDGDQILTVLAAQLKRNGQLAGDAVVVTVMSNLGFYDAMRESGISVIQTPVGDKHVYAAMRDGGYVLGGEQSGHIIQLGHATTGDGVLTGLHLLAAVNLLGVPLSAAAKMMTRYPQVLINVRGDKDRAMADPALAPAVDAAQARLGDSGRVLLRPSGTEPVIRVMVEARTPELAEEIAGQLADAVRLAMA